jgi:hypothetical protein
MRHVREPGFHNLYDGLPKDIQRLADKNFALLKQDPTHPSLRLKRIYDDVWSARVGRGYRVLATRSENRFQWFWIGSHAAYDRIVDKKV